ncbi:MULTISPECIES: hypothetical protein [Pseudomonas putida group]|uniref:Uncharacterized protein n=1 Tax=Pseudomonas monteilii SB3101 TaxID=1435058 RepID=V9V6U7_9PSED|nr:hypothetical protein [Pseudomonas monteilii]AHC84194.1 hypothetical protein X969_20370 [Pseudomonas monteilii SB3078]AHC89565.1 hypothetical protein X970_20005 [Pseudomonas monteilii SB3101]
MQPRFVIVPAVPIENESFQVGNRFYAATTSGGFDIYDNQEKVRIKRGFSSRSTGESECKKMNAECRNPAELFPVLRAE